MLDKRLENFREELRKKGIDGALVFSDVNRNYITGFTGNESYIVVTQKEAVFITDSRYTEQASDEVRYFEIKEYKGSVSVFIADTINALGIKKLGFEEDYMTYSFYSDISSKLPEVELVLLGGLIEGLRQIKSEDEIKLIERAAYIADNAFTEILKFIKEGMTEKEVDLELEFLMRRNGASGLSFPSIVASGKRSSLPHGTASKKKIEYGDFLTLDFGCVYNGYCSDMTRTVVIGKACEKQKEIYDVVLEANCEALKNIRPGITGEDLDKVARDVIEKYGFGKYFGHGLGHGVGMLVHELPYVSKKGKYPLKSGMVITDEPGIYITGFGGVRIEDLVLIEDNGYRVLSHSSKKLIEL